MAREFLPTNRKSVDYEEAFAFGLFYSRATFFVYLPERRAPPSRGGLSGFLFKYLKEAN